MDQCAFFVVGVYDEGLVGERLDVVDVAKGVSFLFCGWVEEFGGV
ncbi:hypothetical protein [Pedobacter sp. NJ-S-72]